MFESKDLSALTADLPSAQDILACCHHLPMPSLLYSGGSGNTSGGNIVCKEPEKSGRFAILGWSPILHRVAHTQAQLESLITELNLSLDTKDTTPGSSDQANTDNHFRTGWMGYFSYDAGEILRGVRKASTPANLPTTPLAEFAYYPTTLLIDLDSNRVVIQHELGVDESSLQQWLTELYKASEAIQNPSVAPSTRRWMPLWSHSDYQNAFAKVQDYLLSGDAYQINLTMPFGCDDDLTDVSPMPLLQNFDAPFSCYWRSESVTLMSVTPERFIRVADKTLITSPIKGTAPRGETPEEDEYWRNWLETSEKNRAENLMIVDLLRNDLGLSAKTGSVTVEKLFEIETHRNVHHMVSTISASLRDDQTPVDAIIDALPGGSITGAPKRRAIEIIAELEHSQRGLYCGSFGYIDRSGHCDFNILIRSVVATTAGAEIRAGGGVVVDSTADSEYEELRQKVGRMMQSPF